MRRGFKSVVILSSLEALQCESFAKYCLVFSLKNTLWHFPFIFRRSRLFLVLTIVLEIKPIMIFKSMTYHSEYKVSNCAPFAGPCFNFKLYFDQIISISVVLNSKKIAKIINSSFFLYNYYDKNNNTTIFFFFSSYFIISFNKQYYHGTHVLLLNVYFLYENSKLLVIVKINF